MDITAKKKIGDELKEITVNCDLGENLEDAVNKFGAEVVFTNARAAFKITAQSAMRRYLEMGLDSKNIIDKMATWKPGVSAERVTVDPVTALMGKWGSMSEAEKKDILAKLKSVKSA
jgi:hypothetical protein